MIDFIECNKITARRLFPYVGLPLHYKFRDETLFEANGNLDYHALRLLSDYDKELGVRIIAKPLSEITLEHAAMVFRLLLGIDVAPPECEKDMDRQLVTCKVLAGLSYHEFTKAKISLVTWAIRAEHVPSSVTNMALVIDKLRQLGYATQDMFDDGLAIQKSEL